MLRERDMRSHLGMIVMLNSLNSSPDTTRSGTSWSIEETLFHDLLSNRQDGEV